MGGGEGWVLRWVLRLCGLWWSGIRRFLKHFYARTRAWVRMEAVCLVYMFVCLVVYQARQAVGLFLRLKI